MRRLLPSALMASAAALTMTLASAPAAAVILVPGSTLVPPTPFAPISGTQGTLQAFQSFSGQALTFATTFRQAVYRNTLGTLDFYFQVSQTGPGSTGRNQEIRSFTVADYEGFVVDAFVSAPDPDGSGGFLAVNNGTSGSTTTFGRSDSFGRVLTTEFGTNGLVQGETSATYIFRTNATSFNTNGTFGIIDGSTISGLTYQPTGLAAIPEPATWAMMIIGFGAIGGAMRRSRTRVNFA